MEGDTSKKNIELLHGSARWYHGWKGIALFVIGSCLLSFLVLFLYQFANLYRQMRSGDLLDEKMLTQYAPYSMAELFDPRSPWLGNRDAKVIIVEFGDFNCPICNQEYPIVKEMVEKYKDKVLFSWRNYPVISQSSPELANGGVCANQKGLFWQYHDAIMAFNGAATREQMIETAMKIGIDRTEFEKCLENKMTVAQVRKDVYASQTGDVNGTPTFFVSGIKLEGALTMATWDKLITKLLTVYEKDNGN